MTEGQQRMDESPSGPALTNGTTNGKSNGAQGLVRIVLLLVKYS